MRNIQKESAASVSQLDLQEASITPARFVDLAAEICPMTYVKFKLHIEQIASGELIEIMLKEGEHMRNMPRHIKEEGHLIEKVTKEGDKYCLLVRKVV